ncbi:hypothetical protein AB0J82_17830 [Asanoa sp. NPDC049518]|uniref:hypothetical protein n=1 Tax=unclassified Asanoa TaxID=2685164 RepID=UPI00343BEF23
MTPRRGVQAVLAAMAQDPPPHRLLLSSRLRAVTATFEEALADVRACEWAARGAGFPSGGWTRQGHVGLVPTVRGSAL